MFDISSLPVLLDGRESLSGVILSPLNGGEAISLPVPRCAHQTTPNETSVAIANGISTTGIFRWMAMRAATASNPIRNSHIKPVVILTRHLSLSSFIALLPV